MTEPNLALAAANSGIAKELYADLKHWLAKFAALIRKATVRSNADRFSSPEVLFHALKSGTVRDGDRVVLECKPSSFGPFLRGHFLTFMVGMQRGKRLGPVFDAGPLTLIANAVSHLTPVGLFPPLEGGVSQVCLYPSTMPVAGMTSMLAEMAPQVPYIPALFLGRFTPYCHMACHVSGTIRLVDSAALASCGVSPEVYEELRQAGGVWVLDATTDDSDCIPISDGVTGEFWGGLYAAGHLELVKGVPDLRAVVEVFSKGISLGDEDVEVVQNQAGRREISICGNGVRASLDTQFPVFSIHMDAELGFGFAEARRRFDSTCTTILSGIRDVCESQLVTLGNPMDLDFSYANSTSAFSVLRSQSADIVSDPVLISIRDWHRQRSSRS